MKKKMTEQSTETGAVSELGLAEEMFAPWGNAAMAQDLGGTDAEDGGSGILGAAEEEVDEIELGLHVDAAGTAAGQMIEARIDVLDDLHNDSEPVRVPNAILEAIKLAAVASTGSASAGIGAAASLKISEKLVSEKAKVAEAFTKAAFKDFIDGRIDAAATAGVEAIGDKFIPIAGGPAHDAFFEGQMIGLRTTVADAELKAKRTAREVAMKDDDPVEVAAAIAAGLKFAIVDAPPLQRASGVSEWLNLNARMDLGEVEEGQGADLRGMEWDNLSWKEIVAGEPAYGVIRAEIVGLGTEGIGERYVVNNVLLAGTNPDFIDQFRQCDMTLEEMGMNLFVSGHVWQNVGPTSWVEFGKNDGGAIFIAARSDLSESWLGFYHSSEYSVPPYIAPADPEAWAVAKRDAHFGAMMILGDLLEQKPKDLKIAHG